jgi:hypothetical protein
MVGFRLVRHQLQRRSLVGRQLEWCAVAVTGATASLR